MQHAIGDHALLADGRTAALIAPDGNVAWLCWPRVDSAPLLLSLLDEQRGGCFYARPLHASGDPQRAYVNSSLVLRTRWDAPRVTLDDALALEGGIALLRCLRAAEACEVEVGFRPSFDAGRAKAKLRVAGQRLVARGGSLSIAVQSPGTWSIEGGTAITRFSLAAGDTQLVCLADESSTTRIAGDVDSTIASWQARLAPSHATAVSRLATGAADEPELRALIVTSTAVLLGLLQRGGGIVAAPTTSLPQWPASSRTWDYRYCWLRDASLAGLALMRAGHHQDAHSLGAFLGAAVVEHGPSPLVRVDGSPPPAETVLSRLSGYRGAKPVRIGNAAAAQAQLDAPAELLELTWALAAHGDLPTVLRRAAALCADWMASHWTEPDHGIWEIRGPPRNYTHSRVMACAALNGAVLLAERGVLRGDAERWRRAAAAIRPLVGPGQSGALELHAGGGGADAALSLAAHVGFLEARDLLFARTLRFIEERLEARGLLQRYEGTQDEVPDPCAPFVFPAFWMAEALHAAGLDGTRFFAAAMAARGPLNLFGEVADPGDHSPLGNYPQVQSHAAFLLAALHG